MIYIDDLHGFPPHNAIYIQITYFSLTKVSKLTKDNLDESLSLTQVTNT